MTELAFVLQAFCFVFSAIGFLWGVGFALALATSDFLDWRFERTHPTTAERDIRWRRQHGISERQHAEWLAFVREQEALAAQEEPS